MKLRQLTSLLWILLFIFGIFYFAGTLIEISWFSPFTDLWANLFASLIVLLVIEHIVRQSRLEGIEPSKRYITGKILQIITELMHYVKPPSDWKTRLESGSEWTDYFEKLVGVRKEALEELQKILINPAPVLDDRLRNYVTSIVETLTTFSWKIIEINRGKDIWGLCEAASISATVISQSIDMIKQNDLLKNRGRVSRGNEGKAPKIEVLKNGCINKEYQYSLYEKWLNLSIEFRDECNRRQFPKSSS